MPVRNPDNNITDASKKSILAVIKQWDVSLDFRKIMEKMKILDANSQWDRFVL